MKAVSARVSRALNLGANVFAADNSGARIVRITSVKHGKSTKGRQQYARVGDWVKCSVRAGKPEMRGQVFDAVVIRKGTQIKGPVAREVHERWAQVARIAQFVL